MYLVNEFKNGADVGSPLVAELISALPEMFKISPPKQVSERSYFFAKLTPKGVTYFEELEKEFLQNHAFLDFNKKQANLVSQFLHKYPISDDFQRKFNGLYIDTNWKQKGKGEIKFEIKLTETEAKKLLKLLSYYSQLEDLQPVTYSLMRQIDKKVSKGDWDAMPGKLPGNS